MPGSITIQIKASSIVRESESTTLLKAAIYILNWMSDCTLRMIISCYCKMAYIQIYSPITINIGIWFVVPINFIYANDVKYACESAMTNGNPKLNAILNFNPFAISFV